MATFNNNRKKKEEKGNASVQKEKCTQCTKNKMYIAEKRPLHICSSARFMNMLNTNYTLKK